jgi:Family of unknown function (DUF6011)
MEHEEQHEEQHEEEEIYYRCLRCRRHLHSPQSRRLGYGPVCLAYMRQVWDRAPTPEEVNRAARATVQGL